MAYTTELFKISAIKAFTKILPSKGKFRIVKKLYNYESPNKNGIDICVPYLNDLKLLFLLNTKELIGWHIFFFGEYEKSTNSILRKYIKEGDVVVEAGANNGSESILLGKLVGKGKVHCFEPIPHVFERLKFNVDINQLKTISLYQLALGEENKNVIFNLYPKNFPNQGMSSKYGENAITTRLEVKQVTLDSWVEENNIKNINFLKMDIQGAELDLLKGAMDSLRKFKPIIFTEAESWNNIQELFKIIHSLEYKIHLLTNTGMKLIDSDDKIKPGNWLAIPRERAN